MRPYLEVEVVKVKKKNKHKLSMGEVKFEGKTYKLYFDDDCGLIGEEQKGNWVNGENLDKIKFPCFCSYISNNKKTYGMIVTNYILEEMKDVYDLIHINSQSRLVACEFTNESLEELIKVHQIHILKGKIILFEEE